MKVVLDIKPGHPHSKMEIELPCMPAPHINIRIKLTSLTPEWLELIRTQAGNKENVALWNKFLKENKKEPSAAVDFKITSDEEPVFQENEDGEFYLSVSVATARLYSPL